MTRVSEWVEDISRDYPEAFESIIQRCVRFALQSFFKTSESWVHTENIPLIEGLNRYNFNTLPFDTYVINSKNAYLTTPNGERRQLSASLKDRIDPTISGSPENFAVERYGVILDGEVSGGMLEIQCVLQPNRNINEVDDEFADSWYDDIRKGAIGELKLLPDKRWTDVKGAAVYLAMANEAALKAKRESRNDRSRPKRSVRFNPGFRW